MNVSENIRFTGANLDAAFARVPEVAAHELLAAMAEADSLLEREVKDLMPTASGVSRASVFSREQALPGGVIGMVGSAMPQIVYVELGTKPHFPPLAPLEDWVRVKFGFGDDKKVAKVAYLIARKIAQRGTLGVGMFHRTWAKQRPQVEMIFRRATERIVKQMGAAT